MVVPAIACVEQAVVVLFIDPWKEDQKPAPDGVFAQGQDFGNADETKQRSHAIDGNHRVFGGLDGLERLGQLAGNRRLERRPLGLSKTSWGLE